MRKKLNLCDLLWQRIDLNIRSKNNSSNQSFVKRRARQFVPFFIIDAVKKLAFKRLSDFRTAKTYFAMFEKKTKVVLIILY